MIRTQGRASARGFSLLELLIVVVIALVVAVIAIPRLMTSTEAFKLRSTASSVSGLVQKARMLAVARNALVPVLTTGSGSNIYAFVDADNSGSMNSTAEGTSILMPGTIVFDPNGAHPSDATILNGLTAVRSLPRFNPRGLPCFLSSGVCQVNSGNMYITFLRQDRTLGATGWAAINVTPAGRVQVWTWDGNRWE
jgi:prepilin-type N-terminal cleavage/methylation domain-containing protein